MPRAGDHARGGWPRRRTGVALFHRESPAEGEGLRLSRSGHMNHIAFRVDRADFDAARERLAGARPGVRFSDHGQAATRSTSRIPTAMSSSSRPTSRHLDPLPAAAEIEAELAALADPQRAEFVAPYLGAVPGGYGEGDVLLGMPVPAQRKVARAPS